MAPARGDLPDILVNCACSHVFRSSKMGLDRRLPGLHSSIRRLAPNVLLDTIKFGDAVSGLFGNRLSLGFVDVYELAPDMG